jgi:hypothetical protein
MLCISYEHSRWPHLIIPGPLYVKFGIVVTVSGWPESRSIILNELFRGVSRLMLQKYLKYGPTRFLLSVKHRANSVTETFL